MNVTVMLCGPDDWSALDDVTPRYVKSAEYEPLGRLKDATPSLSVGFVIWVPLAAVTLTVAPPMGRPKRSTALKISG